jgi:hypothetical protein
LKAQAKPKPRLIVSAVVTRADGTVEDLGIIADSKKPTIIERIKKWLRQ